MFELKRNKFKRVLRSFISITLISASLLYFGPQSVVSASSKGQVKNVIMMIPDGTSIEAVTLARWYNGGEPFAMDEIAVGLTRTYWSDGPITDSAPGSTAYSTGFKTFDKYVGVVKENGVIKPKATILEAAKLSGRSTGLVVTCEAMHATPADFSAHEHDRQNYNSIAKQQVYGGIDVVLGGGHVFLTPEAGSKRKDGQDLVQVLKSLDYEYITTKDEMEKSKASKLWGMFAPKDMMYDIDRVYNDSNQPTLAEMTNKALDILSKDEDGFFLMVEGSKVDWAAHANDPAGVVSDITSFTDAVEEAINFAKKDGNTVVIVSADHGTGGLSIGSTARDAVYSSVTFDETVNRLKGVQVTAETFNKLMTDKDGNIVKTDEELRNLVEELYGITDLTDEQLALVKDKQVNKVVSAWANVGWTTGGHVGGDVALFNYAPPGVSKLSGVVENTAVADYMQDVLGLNLANTTDRLFGKAMEVFKGMDSKLDASDKDNPKLIVTKDQDTLTLYGYTNKGMLNDKELTLEGVTLFIMINGEYKLEDVYVPAAAVEFFKK